MFIKEVAFLEGRLLSNQSERFKKPSKSFDWLEKAGLPKAPLLFWTYVIGPLMTRSCRMVYKTTPKHSACFSWT